MATEEKKQEPTSAKALAEKQTNCLACNKPIKKIRRYYRNGKFYCTKKCWKKAQQPKKEEEK